MHGAAAPTRRKKEEQGCCFPACATPPPRHANGTGCGRSSGAHHGASPGHHVGRLVLRSRPSARRKQAVATRYTVPRGYLDYDARADTSLAKGVAILRQLPSRNGSLRRPCDWSMNRPETHACGADEWRARWLDPANAYDRRIQLSADLSDFSLSAEHESTDAIASHPSLIFGAKFRQP